jgi:GTP pyrophosphokinase
MPLSPRFVEALAYAAEAHRNQVRKGSAIPYFSHPMGVASIALEYGADEDEAIAALLHDVIEDQGSQHRSSIQQRFGERVLRIVLDVSDSEGEPKPPWKDRKLRYLEHLRIADKSAHLVSASDKLHNIRAIVRDYRRLGESLWPRFNSGREGTLWYYRELVQRLDKAPTEIVAEIRTALDEFEMLLKHAGV